MEYKLCKSCGLSLCTDRFNKHSSQRDGLRSKCIECRRLEHIEYRKKNPEKMRILQRKIDARKVSSPEQKEKKKNRAKLYNESEHGKIKNRERHRKWYLENKNRIVHKRSKYGRNGAKRWRALNRDKSNALYAKRRAGKKNATPKWLTNTDFTSIIELYTISAMFKVYTGSEYHVDHIVPLNNPIVCGLHVPWNLRIIPAKENMSKNNRFHEEFGIDFSASAYL